MICSSRNAILAFYGPAATWAALGGEPRHAGQSRTFRFNDLPEGVYDLDVSTPLPENGRYRCKQVRVKSAETTMVSDFILSNTTAAANPLGVLGFPQGLHPFLYHERLP
jgi:hypothetical protein